MNIRDYSNETARKIRENQTFDLIAQRIEGIGRSTMYSPQDKESMIDQQVEKYNKIIDFANRLIVKS